VVLAGRRVPLASYIPYWRQFTTPEALAAREADVRSFFRAEDAASAIDAARRLGARYVYFSGPSAGAPPPPGGPRSVRDRLLDAGALAPVHVEPRAGVFRITPLAAGEGCEASGGL
jgi:sugar phosphate isomerase/epimerase